MQFRISVIMAVIFVLSPIVAWAAATATIAVPKAGDHYYWFTYTDIKGEEVTTTPVSFDGKKTTAELPLVKDAVPKCRLFVLDAQAGNEAVVQVDPAEAEGKPFKFDVKPAGFDRVRRVEVVVTAASTRQPAASAIVKLEDAEKVTQTQVLDPSAEGVVRFMDVPSGTAKITVAYGEGKTASQDIDISLEREKLVPSIEVPVVGEIETIQPAAEKEPGKAGKPSSRRAGAPINFPMALVGLALFAAILYAAYWLMRGRGMGFRQVMKKMGVEIPEEQPPAAPSQPAPAAPVDPSVCPFCGGKKDPATGTCACSVGAAPAPAAPGAVSAPRLVATQGDYAGSIYALEAGTVSIGREESNTIAFSQDSTVSRRHARITGPPESDDFTIHDEGSSNGTFVNGVRVTEQVLRPGDEVQIGNTRLRFEA